MTGKLRVNGQLILAHDICVFPLYRLCHFNWEIYGTGTTCLVKHTLPLSFLFPCVYF